jgi:hypothetical protein
VGMEWVGGTGYRGWGVGTAIRAKVIMTATSSWKIGEKQNFSVQCQTFWLSTCLFRLAPGFLTERRNF